MERKLSSFKNSMDEADLDRLSFIVYKKAMSLIGYTGAVLSLGVGLFVFFGFDQWKNISAKLEHLELKISQAEMRTSEAQHSVSELGTKSLDVAANLAQNNENLKTALIETGKMMQVKEETAGLEGRINKQVAAILGGIEEAEKRNTDDLDRNLKALQNELTDSAESRAGASRNSTAFQQRIEQASLDLRSQVERSLDAGFTILVLQDKHLTPISVGDIRISLGDAKDKVVKDVAIYFGAEKPVREDFLAPNKEMSFSRIDARDNKMRKYTFKILEINMLAFRDLVTCELRWELETADRAEDVSPAS